jgi:CheY-like chemotaxis protein
MEQKTILALDDVADVRNFVKSTLSKAGYNVITLDSPRGAFEILESNKIDLIICDLNMPYQNGFTFLETIKDSDYKDIPFCILTNIESEEYREKAKNLGAACYWHKFESGEQRLLEEVSRLL